MTLVSGTMQGQATFRWGTPPELEEAADRLASLSLSNRSWNLIEQQSVDPIALRLLRSAGYLQHVYENGATKELVTVAIFAGPTGPMVAHTPVVCYSANDYEVIAGPDQASITADDGVSHELFVLTLQSNDVHQDRLRIYYGWSNGEGGFQAPDNPRIAFADDSFIYRIQAATRLSNMTSEDAARAFLRTSLSQVDGALKVK